MENTYVGCGGLNILEVAHGHPEARVFRQTPRHELLKQEPKSG